MKTHNIYLFFVVLITLGIVSCTPKYLKQLETQKIENPQSQKEIDKNTIVNHLITNKLNYEMMENGIYYTMTKEGTGLKPQKNSVVKAHYKGTLLDGTQFDSSYDRGEPLKFGLGRVIKGWQEILLTLNKGAKGTFIIPSGLAYGKRGAGGTIPADAVLIFDIELVEFVTPQ